ncbi:UDP-glucose:undecaprenyl-phosphate glucose-1-phosphate transferase [Lacunisphaera limnophila]|uniref:UDP-glucose:undecaprenyl-phosphate glucose-1-phosphate transferase n=1 Tax=Lacunisphaera limnophila TaxID=1838286 RepID=A0A1D8AYC7_9BACT|nr:exopolysaccharide biosynthesis polyprenyl glycosylphosphotransferase [Lacunisphaera limnophila]AOS45885.1 UDP-glucose:undecaprenyl-phosphate glucose-1-phosphate transferase [Lacunisphaera limnophila]
MFVQRLRGLINLHILATMGMALGLMAGYAALLPFLPYIDLTLTINLMPYYLCVALGMMFSGRFVQQLVGRFHRLTWADAAWLATRQIGVVVLVVFAFMFAFKDRSLSRLFMGTYLVVAWLALIFLNHTLPRMLSWLFFEHARRVPTLFVGRLGSLEHLKGWLATKEVLGLHPVGFLSLDGAPAVATMPPFLGELPDLGQRIEDTGAGQVVMLEIPRNQPEGRYVIEACQNKGARLLIYSNLAEQLRHPLVTVNEEGHQFYTLQEEPLEDPFNRILKRSFDIAIALPVVMFFLPPLIVLVWLMQRLQAPGPLFHVQERTGYGHQLFRMHKLRSMYAAKRDESAEAQQASKGDARIYPFGRFLRRTSLDEFPQFWDVLIGNMSAVGPRPHLPAHDELFAKQLSAYRTRFFVKPGITGLAQSKGFRGEITEPALLEKRIEHDLDYIANWSIWIDLVITVKTIQQILFPPKSAY